MMSSSAASWNMSSRAACRAFATSAFLPIAAWRIIATLPNSAEGCAAIERRQHKRPWNRGTGIALVARA